MVRLGTKPDTFKGNDRIPLVLLSTDVIRSVCLNNLKFKQFSRLKQCVRLLYRYRTPGTGIGSNANGTQPTQWHVAIIKSRLIKTEQNSRSL